MERAEVEQLIHEAVRAGIAGVHVRGDKEMAAFGGDGRITISHNRGIRHHPGMPIVGEGYGKPQAQWSVVTKKTGASSYTWGAFYYSSLLLDGAPGNTISITGLAALDLSSGMLSMAVPGILYLECVIAPYADWDTAVITSATVKTDSGSDLPNGGAFEMTYSAGPPATGTPTKSRIILAQSYTGSGPDPIVVQGVTGQLTMVQGLVTNYDSSGANPLVIMTTWPEP